MSKMCTLCETLRSRNFQSRCCLNWSANLTDQWLNFFVDKQRKARFEAWASKRGLKDKARRVGRILIGEVSLQDEERLFEFLCNVESDMLIDKTDPLGCSKHTEFAIELIDENVKPVCHDVRRCSKQK